jgi:hypothetical protein
MATSKLNLPASASILAAALAVIAGLIMLGTPSRARQRRLDDVRVRDLSSISNALDAYWSKHSVLPDTVDSLVSTHLLDRIPADPVSGVRYPIHLTGARSYRLCATFAQPLDTADESQDNYFGGPYRGRHSWQHGAGESCFDFKADTARPGFYGGDMINFQSR